MKGSVAGLAIAMASGAVVGTALMVAVMAATPTPTTSYDVPYSYTVDVPYSNSVKDAVGRTITVSGVNHLTASGTNHFEIAEPPPVPVGITFGSVTSGINDEMVVAKPSGWICTLHGSGFPTAGILRLQVAGRIAPSATLLWQPTAVQFTVPPGPPSVTSPVTGPFEVYVQENGLWRLLGRGGAFTILPSVPAAARKR